MFWLITAQCTHNYLRVIARAFRPVAIHLPISQQTTTLQCGAGSPRPVNGLAMTSMIKGEGGVRQKQFGMAHVPNNPKNSWRR